MLREYGVEPRALEDWNHFRLVVGGCGLPRGRLIADFPRDGWTKEVFEFFETNPANSEITISKAEVMLRELKPALVSTGRNFSQTLTWLANAERTHSHKPFAAIITAEHSFEHPKALYVDLMCDGDELWVVATSQIIKNTPAQIAASVAPLLGISSEILLVDPHFNPLKSRFRKTLNAILVQAAATHRQFHRIEYHTEHDNLGEVTPEEFEADCRQQLPQEIPQGMILVVVQWEKQAGEELLHPRFVLTERGGIAVDVGLDAGRPGQTTDIYLLSDKVYSQRWADYQPATSKFKVVNRFSVIGAQR